MFITTELLVIRCFKVGVRYVALAYSVVQAGLRLLILMLKSHKYLYYRHV